MSLEAFRRQRGGVAAFVLVLVLGGHTVYRNVWLHSRSGGIKVDMSGPVRVVCLGDSLTAGYSPGSPGHGFTPYATNLSVAMVHQPNKVTTLGFSGFTADDLLLHSNDVVRAPLTEDVMLPGIANYLGLVLRTPPAHLAIIMAGSNDMAHIHRTTETGTRILPCKSIITKLINLHSVALKFGAAATLALGVPDSNFVHSSSEMRECRRSINEGLEGYPSYDSRVHYMAFPIEYNTTGKNGIFWDADRLHLSPAGYAEAGRLIAVEVDAILDLLSSS